MTQARENYYVKIASVVASLVEKGYAPPEEKYSLTKEMVEYPEKIAEVLEQVIQSSELPVLGGPASNKPGSSMDALTRFALEGPQGMIERGI